MDDVAILARAWPVDVPLRVWLHLNCTLFLPLYSECAPSMKIYWWRASFLVLLDHSLHCDCPPPPFVPRFFSSSGATRRGKGTGEIGICFFLGDVLSRMANLRIQRKMEERRFQSVERQKHAFQLCNLQI